MIAPTGGSGVALAVTTGVVGGLAGGRLYFAALAATVDRFAEGGCSPMRLTGFVAARLGIMAGGLWLAARFAGAPAVLSALAGMLVARRFAILRRQADE